MQNKFIINVCLNGMVAANKDNPHLPGRSPHTISETRPCPGL